jgi:hypothetical protein
LQFDHVPRDAYESTAASSSRSASSVATAMRAPTRWPYCRKVFDALQQSSKSTRSDTGSSAASGREMPPSENTA